MDSLLKFLKISASVYFTLTQKNGPCWYLFRGHGKTKGFWFQDVINPNADERLPSQPGQSAACRDPGSAVLGNPDAEGVKTAARNPTLVNAKGRSWFSALFITLTAIATTVRGIFIV